MKIVRWAFQVGSWQPTEQEWAKICRCIQAEEKERIGRFVFRKDAKSSMVGRLLIRKFVSEVTSLRNGNINLSRDDRGKPFLANNSKFGILFNVSHQGDFAVLVGAKGINEAEHRIGVDVMKIEYSGGKSQDEFFRIMGRNFSTEEWTNIRGAGNETSRLAAFCRHWSLKESYVKATGTGITVNLQDISFKIHSPLLPGSTVCDTNLRIAGQAMTDWKFEENLLDQQHCVALACNFPFTSDTFKLLSIAELISDLEPFLTPDPEYCKAFFAKDERP